MTPDQILAVRSSFALVAPLAEQAAATFYERLFAVDPALRMMFRGDMAQQGQRLMQMIAAAVGLLERPAQLVPVLQQLGRRHMGYGVQATHYESVGTALLQTLGEELGEAFDAPTRAAWAALYNVVSSHMQSASVQHSGNSESAAA